MYSLPCSFLHCGDIHLGHTPYNEYERMEDFASAFRQVVLYALLKKVDFVLISGDFFHKRAINAEVLAQAVELLGPLKEAGIAVIAIEGNHDKAFYQDRNSWLWFLNTQGYLRLLKPHFQEGLLGMSFWEESMKSGAIIDLPQARIYGAGYLGVTTASRLEEVLPLLERGKDKPTILMLHAAINRLLASDLGGIKKEVLEPFREKIDYLALGHIHSRYEMDDWIYNPGALEHVHLDEFGEGNEKGFYHVILKDTAKEVLYIPSKYRPVAFYYVELTGTLKPEDVYLVLEKEIREKHPPKKGQVRVVLKGTIPFNAAQLDLNRIAEQLKNEHELLYIEILNHTNLPLEITKRTDLQLRREDIEDLVFSQLLKGQGMSEEGLLAESVQTVRAFKEMVLRGDQEEEIINFLVSSSARLQAKQEAGEEAAAAVEGGELL